MVTLLGAIIGFLGSILPEFLSLLSDWRDKRHELALLTLQMKQDNQHQLHKMEALGLHADQLMRQSMYRHTWRTDIPWVDALNGTVRPAIAYGFFGLYATVKVMQYCILPDVPLLPWHIESLWDENDQAIFAGIISFYFGQRSLNKRTSRTNI